MHLMEGCFYLQTVRGKRFNRVFWNQTVQGLGWESLKVHAEREVEGSDFSAERHHLSSDTGREACVGKR